MKVLAMLVSCSEYDVGQKVPHGPASESSTSSTTPLVGLPVLVCNDEYSETMPWVKSPNWYESTQPADADDRMWYESDFDTPSDWLALEGLPDQDLIAEDNDVFYRAEFELTGVVGTTEIEFIGNDGVWLYVNDWFVGHWGGEWREGGCINVDEGCSINYAAPPTDVTPLLQAGRNVIAVMLTNGPAEYSLDIHATCVE
jgi:hypothetical protein